MATEESLTLDGLPLNDANPFFLESVEFPVPEKLLEWVRASESDGSVLGRLPLYDNREITARVRVEQRASQDLALAAIGTLVDKLQEAERNPRGIQMTWTPANSTKTITFYVLAGEVMYLPVTVAGDDAGWFVNAPVLNIKLTCFPFGYGTEVVSALSVTSSLPLITGELSGVPGDVPAEGRIILTDAATQARRLARWGLESRYYPTSSPPGLILDSDSELVAASGALATRTGAYDPNATGNNVIRATLAPQPLAVCNVADQPHVGTFHVFARVWAVASVVGSVYVGLQWRDGAGALRANGWATPPVINGWSEVDLGLISVDEKLLGSVQRWAGVVRAYSTAAVGTETVDIDTLLLIPAGEGYGEAAAAANDAEGGGSLTVYDSFDGRVAGTLLPAGGAPVGGGWATSGSATDFTAVTGGLMRRSTTSEAGNGRYAVVGTNLTDCEVAVDVLASAQAAVQTVGARWVDINNHLVADWMLFGGAAVLTVRTRVAGVASVLTSVALPGVVGVGYRLRLAVYQSGVGFVEVTSGGVLVGRVAFSDATLKTGGALASGKGFMADLNASVTANNRDYNAFMAAVPAAERIVCAAVQSIEFRSDGTLAEDTAGTFWGAPPSYRGSRVTSPVAGTRARKVRIAAMMRRNNTLVAADDQIADSMNMQVNYTPRYLVVPR